MKKPHCSKCGRALTDPFSIAVGMGPECRGGMARKGWKFPKPRYQVRGGRVVLVEMVGKVEQPTPTLPSPKRKARLEEEVKDEKIELVRRHLRNGGRIEDAVNALQDYMVEKDSRVTLRWCREFVQRTINKMNAEAEHDLKSESD